MTTSDKNYPWFQLGIAGFFFGYPIGAMLFYAENFAPTIPKAIAITVMTLGCLALGVTAITRDENVR